MGRDYYSINAIECVYKNLLNKYCVLCKYIMTYIKFSEVQHYKTTAVNT